MARKASLKRKKSRARQNGSGGKWVGKSVNCKEAARLVRGEGKFVDDHKMNGMLYLHFVRSPYSHARIQSLDVSEAEASPGVVCTLTGPEVARLVQPFIEIGPEPGAKIVDYPMGVDKVRYQGEPVAAIVAESPTVAEDAAEAVRVDYETLQPVLDAEEALQNNSILHESAGTNMVWHGVFEYGKVEKAFRDAAYIVNIDHLHFHRFSSTPLETNAVIACWERGNGGIQFWCNNSFPAFAIQFLAPALGVRIDQIRVRLRRQVGGQVHELQGGGAAGPGRGEVR